MDSYFKKKQINLYVQENEKKFGQSIFFIFNLALLTDRLPNNGLPQIHHSKDQPTMALHVC